VQQQGRAGVLQSPVNYTVLTSASRAGSYDGPYQIINRSLEFAIWAAGNPSVSVGTGTVIYPGTSATWEQDGDLWLIPEGGTAEVTISYDVSTWQPNPIAIATAILNSGVIVVDNPVEFFANLVLTGNPTDLFDISRYQSISVDFNAFPNPIVTKELNVYIEWYESENLGTLIATQLVQFIPGADTPKWSAQLPCIGAFVRFSCVGQAGSSCLVQAVASHRSVDTMTQTIYENSTGTVSPWLYIRTDAINNGQNIANNYWGPWYGEIECTIDFATAGPPGANSVVSYNSWIPGAPGLLAAELIDNRWLVTPFGMSMQTRFAMAGSMMQASIVNGTGVNTTFYFKVKPLTGY